MDAMTPRVQLRWKIQQASKDGETISGDGFVVHEFSNGYLISVFDGLGHGPEAHAVSKKVKDYFLSLKRPIWNETLNGIFANTNTLLRGTRGIVLTSVFINTINGTLEWAGVGNVEGIVFHKNRLIKQSYERLVTQNGIIGFNLPKIFPKVVSLVGESIIILYTDGILDFSNRMEEINYKIQFYSIKELSESIFQDFRNSQDDALVWIGNISWKQSNGTTN
jgi:serine phosphatase RsbU (regulator of sigma subunit)